MFFLLLVAMVLSPSTGMTTLSPYNTTALDTVLPDDVNKEWPLQSPSQSCIVFGYDLSRIGDLSFYYRTNDRVWVNVCQSLNVGGCSANTAVCQQSGKDRFVISRSGGLTYQLGSYIHFSSANGDTCNGAPRKTNGIIRCVPGVSQITSFVVTNALKDGFIYRADFC